jgi:CDP-glycerol glycerophosphotransferase
MQQVGAGYQGEQANSKRTRGGETLAVPRISVVVPFYNNGDVLADCLRSIASQTFRDLEVIMVDDGSTDDGPQIAQAQAEADPRFTLLTVPNGGPGFARNRGAERASGEFLAFVDGDDMLPPQAYEVLLHTLEKSGSDFVSGNVYRIGPEGIRQSALHSRAIKGRRIGTHITRAPQLLYDISVWNKLFRRSFWDAHSLSYPEGMVWEDIQLMTKAHVLAKAVDVIGDLVYYWRERGRGAFSITQNRTDIRNLRDRITALLAIDRFLAGNAPAKLLRQHQRKALVNDLWLYVGDLSRVSDDYLTEFLDLTNQYLSQVSRRVFRTLPAICKLAYYLIERRAVTQLKELLDWRLEQQVTTVPMVRRLGRLRADLPFRTDRTLRIPARIYRPHWRDLDPFVLVEGVGWQGNRMIVNGCAYVPSVDISRRRNTSKIVILRPSSRRRPPIIVWARSLPHPLATAISGQDRYSYEWAGFRFEISPRWFRFAGRWLTGDWDVFMLIRAHGVWRPARVHTPVVGSAQRPGFVQLAPDVRFGAKWVGRQLHVALTRTPVTLAGFHRAGDDVVIEVDAAGQELPAGQGAKLVLSRQAGAASQPFNATIVDAGGPAARLRAAVPMAALAVDTAGPVVAGPVVADPVVAGTGLMEWELYLTAPGRPRARVAFPAGMAEARYSYGAREVSVEQTRYGDVMIVQRTPKPVIEEHSWSPAGELLLRGSYQGAAESDLETVLRLRGSSAEHILPWRRDGGRFTIEIAVGRVPLFGELVPLRDGVWDMFVRHAEGDGELIPLGYDHARLAAVTEKEVVVGPKTYLFTTSEYDAPVIRADPDRRWAELGNFNQRVMRRGYYPLQRRMPLRDAVFFTSWKGKACADNPLGIADELRRRGDDREHIWAVADWSTPAPDGATVVLHGTEEYYTALARSRYVIANDDMHYFYRKRDGQVYLQTWHGTPLKRIGFDIERPQFASGTAYFTQLANDVAQWDALLSPNPFSTRIMRRAFRFEGDIWETGYPRNDVLARDESGAVAASVRRRLGLPDGKRVVLYAPTWRDNQYYASGRYRFDLRLDLQRAWQMLGPDYVILVRGHHQMADDTAVGERRGFALDVSRYPEVSELFLASDVLVTDYSSVMFDFALTGRPMIFFTYDLDEYRDELRGFYFDLQAEAPGPLLATSDGVLAAIADLDTTGGDHAAAYQAFVTKYCPLDDGKAAARVCERLFGT